MSFPVYSTRVFAGAIATTNAWTTVYTVPTGKVLLTRTITVQNTSSAASDIYFGGVANVAFLKVAGLAVDAVLAVDTFLIFGPGDLVRFLTRQQPILASVHGQLLTAS